MSDEVKRQPVAFRYDAINPAFLKMLAEIGHYASEKYGSWEQYSKARLVGEKGPINHIYEHLRQYVMGEPYDHFEGDVGRHLAAIAYNAMMEHFYLKKFGYVAHPLDLNSAQPARNAPLTDIAKNVAAELGVSIVDVPLTRKHSEEDRTAYRKLANRAVEALKQCGSFQAGELSALVGALVHAEDRGK